MLNSAVRKTLPFTSFLILLLIWELTVRFAGWSTQVLPAPTQVVMGAVELLRDGRLIKDSVASLYRVTVGFYLAVIIGVPLGIFLGRVALAYQMLNPLIQFLRPISPLAWIPLAMLWFGIGELPAIFLIFLSCFFALVTSTMISVMSIKPIHFQVAMNFGFSRYEMLQKVIIPAILPEIITSFRITVGIAWLVVVAAEMIAVQSGLGFLILDSRNALRMDYVLVGMITIGLIGIFLDRGMKSLTEIRELEWRRFVH
ncbi:ABC transporter, permease protein (cluster 10, nitrate/sulfonate/bicarbonate) [hydrothermal vent metagenome]|uniref:ABC transporter, permease protein (Cluster 10, nitrate/sulfonate/bicarbonate) n=1 Tax=hydrothermal vent metagenome TaxID=652676 RepID=A0A3B1C266_9ZZZZ